jgi:NitT/TauT family transport system substrate-binding protein
MQKRENPRRMALHSLASLGLTGLGLNGCMPFKTDPIRIGAQPWPGYELIYLARELKFFNDTNVTLIETPSASANLRGLATRSLDGACLTLDEVLTARSNGIGLTIVAVLDESRGADVVLAKPEIKHAKDLFGKTIGVEQTATGAVLLHAALESVGLSLSDVKTSYIPIDEHHVAFLSGKIDAIVTYEPTKSKLLTKGARVIFSSANIPGRILDTIAIRSDVVGQKLSETKALISGHFMARTEWKKNPPKYAPLLADRLDLAPADVPIAFNEVHLPDAQENRDWMTGSPARLTSVAESLGALMVRQGLLRSPPPLNGLFTPDFLI